MFAALINTTDKNLQHLNHNNETHKLHVLAHYTVSQKKSTLLFSNNSVKN